MFLKFENEKQYKVGKLQSSLTINPREMWAYIWLLFVYPPTEGLFGDWLLVTTTIKILIQFDVNEIFHKEIFWRT